MAKLSTYQKHLFAINKDYMDEEYNYAFRFDRESGRSYMAIFTSPMEKHFKIVVSYCGDNDIFKKKTAFNECVAKLQNDNGVILPTCGATLEDCLIEFIYNNFANTWELESL